MEFPDYLPAELKREANKALHLRPTMTAAEATHVATTYLSKSEYVVAVVFYAIALGIRTQQQGDAHPLTLKTLFALASALHWMGKDALSRELLSRLFESRTLLVAGVTQDTCDVLPSIGEALWEFGEKEKAEVMWSLAIGPLEQNLGARHRLTLRTLTNLASAKSRCGGHLEAEALLVQALDGYEHTLGLQHPDALIAANNLAFALTKLERSAEAIGQYRRVLAWQRRLMGAEHDHTLATMENLARALCDADEPAEAEVLFSELVKVYGRTVGPDHRRTLLACHGLANSLANQDKREATVTLRRRVLEASERVSGPDHPDTIGFAVSLAMSAFMQGDFDEAQKQYRRVLLVKERDLGNEDPETLRVAFTLAEALREQENSEEAARLHRRVLLVRERTLGPDHDDTLMSLKQLSMVLKDRHDLKEAERLVRRRLVAQSRTLGADHTSTLLTMNDLAGLRLERGDMVEAESLARRALDGHTRTLGPAADETQRGLRTLATVLHAQGRTAEFAEVGRQLLDQGKDDSSERYADVSLEALLLEESGQIARAEQRLREWLNERAQGPTPGLERRARLNAMNILAHLVWMRGGLAEAERLCRRVLDERTALLGDDHPDTLVSLDNLACILEGLGDHDGAADTRRRAVEGFERRLGPEHPDTLIALDGLAGARRWQGEWAEAEEIRRDILKRASRLGAEHPLYLRVTMNLAKALLSPRPLNIRIDHDSEGLRPDEQPLGREATDRELINRIRREHVGKWEQEAEQLLRSSLAGFERVLGVEHPDTIRCLHSLGQCATRRGQLSEGELLLTRCLERTDRIRVKYGDSLHRAQFGDELGITRIAFELASLRTRLQTPIDSVVEAIERGTARCLLDLLQLQIHGGRSAARQLCESRLWSEERLAAYEADLRCVSELESRARAIVDHGQGAQSHDKRAILEELSAARMRLVESERDLLPIANPKSLGEIRQQLACGEVMLLYGWGELSVTAVQSVTGVLIPSKEAGEPRALWLSQVVVEKGEDRYEAMRREFVTIHSVNAAALTAQAGLLGERSISDLESAAKTVLDFVLPPEARSVIAKATRVIVVPSGPLNDVPLDVLAEIAGVEELMGKPVVTVPSGSIFALLRERCVGNGSFRTTIIGDPDLGTDEPGVGRGQGLEPTDVLVGYRAAETRRLPRARTEAEEIARYFECAKGGKIAPLMDSEATVAKVQVEARGKRVLHFAAHAVLGDMKDPMGSAVLLAPQRSNDGKVVSGRLQLDGLLSTWRDWLRGTDLVVLSCCQTGRGVKLGDSLMALPIGFFHAGARCVLATLWQVDDLATCLLMMRLYQNYLGHHEDVAGNAESQGRHVWGVRYGTGEPMAVSASLEEAKRWLRTMSLDELIRFLDRYPEPKAQSELARPPDNSKTAGKTGLSPTQTILREAQVTGRPPFAEPRFWGAFVVIGDAG